VNCSSGHKKRESESKQPSNDTKPAACVAFIKTTGIKSEVTCTIRP
jgi:hypothetical protein